MTIVKIPQPDYKQSQAQQQFASADNSYTNDATFVTIKIGHIKSIEQYAEGKLKPREKKEINQKFAFKVNAPKYIPKDMLAMNIREGSTVITRQENEFKVRKMMKGKDMSQDGVKVLQFLATQIPIDTLAIDESSNITFKDNNIKIMKPYESSNVKIVDGGDSNQEKEQLAKIKKLVDKAWEKSEQTRKGG